MDGDETRWVLSIEGARLMGPAPISDVWVPLESGVQAFYGLNGAGKTRLLTALGDLYSGSGSGSGYLVGRAVEAPPTSHGDDLRQAIDTRVLERADRRWMDIARTAPWHEPDRSSFQSFLGDVLWSHLSPQESGIVVADERSLLAQVDEVVRQQLFALVPKPGEMQWALHPALRIDGTTPALRADVRRLLAFRDQYLRENGEQQREASTEDEIFESEGRAKEAAQDAAGIDGWGDSLLTTISPFFDTLRDDYSDHVAREGRMLEEAAAKPYRLGDADMFDSYGSVEGPLARLVRSDALSVVDLNRDTCEVLGSTSHGLLSGDGGSVTSSLQLKAKTDRLSDMAVAVYQDLLVEAPDLHIHLEEPEAWFHGAPARWVADDIAGQEVDLVDLSEAQRRWALIAASLALQEHLADEVPSSEELPSHLRTYNHGWMGDRPLILVLDEPDAALHATAQRYAVRGLARLAQNLRLRSFAQRTHASF